MTPLPFVWPYWPAFWLVFAWAFLPEARIIRAAGKAAREPGSQDRRSVQVIALASWLAMLVAFPLAWLDALRLPVPLTLATYGVGILILIGGSLLRRHCWRVLGAAFTGEVRARPDQQIVTTGAYAVVRHPSYTAAIVMYLGIGLALGSWGSTLVLVGVAFAVYAYRISVEEAALLAAVGEPYRQFMRTRRRLIPFVY